MAGGWEAEEMGEAEGARREVDLATATGKAGREAGGKIKAGLRLGTDTKMVTRATGIKSGAGMIGMLRRQGGETSSDGRRLAMRHPRRPMVPGGRANGRASLVRETAARVRKPR
jgi:hypothetical protein